MGTSASTAGRDNKLRSVGAASMSQCVHLNSASCADEKFFFRIPHPLLRNLHSHSSTLPHPSSTPKCALVSHRFELDSERRVAQGRRGKGWSCGGEVGEDWEVAVAEEALSAVHKLHPNRLQLRPEAECNSTTVLPNISISISIVVLFQSLDLSGSGTILEAVYCYSGLLRLSATFINICTWRSL
jgi:hypothetical protein